MSRSFRGVPPLGKIIPQGISNDSLMICATNRRHKVEEKGNITETYQLWTLGHLNYNLQYAHSLVFSSFDSLSLIGHRRYHLGHRHSWMQPLATAEWHVCEKRLFKRVL